MHFHEWNILYFIDSNFNTVCFQGCDWQQSSIGSGNGLAPVRRQAINWTNADPVHRRIYTALGGDESNHQQQHRQCGYANSKSFAVK